MIFNPTVFFINKYRFLDEKKYSQEWYAACFLAKNVQMLFVGTKSYEAKANIYKKELSR